MAETFQSGTREPQIKYAVAGVSPPTPLYVTQDDLLELGTRGSVAGADIMVTSRLLLPDGKIVVLRENIRPSATRGQAGSTRPLTEGFLLSVAFDDYLLFYRRGELYVEAQLIRDTGVSSMGTFPLCSGYLYSQRRLGWPPGLLEDEEDGPGFMRPVTGTDPAAGAEISESVPANAVRRLVAVSFQLVTDGTGTARTVSLAVDDGSSVFYQIEAPATQPISTTRRYTFGIGVNTIAGPTTTLQGALPNDLRMRPSYRFRTITTTLAAGDNFGAPIYLVEEWMAPL